jgi:PAS domain S-box-containing protein
LAGDSGIDASKLQDALDIARIGYWERDLRTDRVLRSAVVDEIFGFRPGEAGGDAETFLGRIHPEDRVDMRRLIATAVETGKPFNQMFRITRVDGAMRWIEARADVVTDRQGQPLRLISVLRDVTEQLQAQEALRASEARAAAVRDELEATYATAPIGMCMLDTDLRYVRINASLAAINGAPAEAHIGRHISEMTPSFAQQHEAALRRVVRTGEPVMNVEVVTEVAGQPGVTRSTEESWYPLRDREGRITGVNAVVVETTEKRHTEQALREALQHRTDTLESISDAFFALSADWRFTYANGRALEMWSLDDAEVLGRGMLEVFPQLRGSEIHNAYLHAMKARETVHLETISPVVGRWLSVTIYPSAGGGLSVYFRDINDRRQADERQKLLAAELDHRAKNMLALVQVMLRQTRAPTVKEFSAAAQGRVAALARAHALLSESRWKGADLKRLIEDELAPYRRSDASRVRFSGPSIQLEPPVAQSLAMVLHELVTNAAKYGALSAPEGRVAIAWERRPSGRLVLYWNETDGPLITTPPKRRGFGTGLIERTVRNQLDGEVHLDWSRNGLFCEIVI